MRRLFRWFSRLLFLVLLLIIVVVVFRNPIVRELAENQIRRETGMETVIGRVRVALKSASVRVDNVRLINPPEYGGQLFADLPDVYIEYDPFSLVLRRIRFERVLFRLDELRVVRNPEGKTNIESLLERVPGVGWNDRLTRYGFTCQGTDAVGFSIGRFTYIDGHDPSRHEETYIGVRGVVVNHPRNLQDVLNEMGRIASEKGARNTADALLGRRPVPLGV